MTQQRVHTHLFGIGLLLVWGGVMMYFCLSGRIASYLPADGALRMLAQGAGIGLIALAFLNLATLGAREAGAAEEAHDHPHEPGATCCGGHHQPALARDTSPSGSRFIPFVILAVPLVAAAAWTPDKFSSAAIINKGLYSTTYTQAAGAPPPSRLTSAKPAAAKAIAPAAAPAVQTMPPVAPPPAGATLAVTPSAGPRVPGSAAPATSSVVVTTLPSGSPSGTAPAAGSMPPAPAPASASATPPAAGSNGKSYGNFTLEDLKSQVPQSKDGNFILEVPELYYTAGDKEVQGVLAGQPVETVAQVLPEKVNNAEGKRLRVFRLLVQCCAADARPYSVPVEFADKAPEVKDMTWVKIVGKMAYRQEGGQTVPIIEARSLTETTAPENAMMY